MPSQKSTRGAGSRPRAPSDEQIARVSSLLRAGNYRHVAAQAAGLSAETLEHFLARGREADTGKAHELYTAVMAAEHEGEARNVALIAKEAQDGNWQAAAWILERRYPGRWAKLSQRERDKELAAATKPPAVDAFSEIDELARRRG